MTGLEIVLLFAVAALAGQVLILQRHYTQKLSDQAAVLSFLLEALPDRLDDPERLEDIRDKIFDSSQ